MVTPGYRQQGANVSPKLSTCVSQNMKHFPLSCPPKEMYSLTGIHYSSSYTKKKWTFVANHWEVPNSFPYITWRECAFCLQRKELLDACYAFGMLWDPTSNAVEVRRLVLIHFEGERGYFKLNDSRILKKEKRKVFLPSLEENSATFSWKNWLLFLRPSFQEQAWDAEGNNMF